MEPVDPRDLVTALVISARLGLSRPQRVHELTRRTIDPLPPHVWSHPRLALWHWPQVREWAGRQDADLVEPGMRVPLQVAIERLGLSPDALTIIDDDGRVEWEVAEQAWIDAMNASS